MNKCKFFKEHISNSLNVKMQQRTGWNLWQKLTSRFEIRRNSSVLSMHVIVFSQKDTINHFSWNAAHRECQADKQRESLDGNVHNQKWASYCFRRWFKRVMKTLTLNLMGIVWWSFEGWICVVAHTKVLHLG